MSRELLAPPLLRIGSNRCYRVNLVHEDFSSQQSAAMKAQKDGQNAKCYLEEDLYGEDYNDDLDGDGNCDIEETSSGVFKLSMHVANSFYGGIIGYKGTTKRRIEAETRCDITIPQRNPTNRSSEANVIIIKGRSRNSVATARRKIQLVVSSLRRKLKATHFYGVFLSSDEIRDSFNKLKSEILAAEIPGIGEELFQEDQKLHLTLGICVLLDEVERGKAVDILQSCREYLSDLKTPFTVNVSGLEIMNDDPSAVRVLYGSVTSEALEIFGNHCLQRFTGSGLGIDDFNRGHVKLHMTIMNQHFRERDCTSRNVDCTSRNFDTREILKRWGNFHFGSAQCNEVLLCAIGSSKETTEFYKITGTLKFS